MMLNAIYVTIVYTNWSDTGALFMFLPDLDILARKVTIL